MTARTRPKRQLATGHVEDVYNSRLQKGGALLEDMRLLVRRWQNAGTNGQQAIVVAENLLGKHTRARVADTLRYAFLPRFVNGRPPQAWKIVRALEDHSLHVEVLRPVYYWITARNERLLYHFVCTELLHHGHELKAWADPLHGNSGWSRIIKSTDCYFRPGITFSNVTSSRVSLRLMPGGFIFDHGGNCVFLNEETYLIELLGILNSIVVAHLLNLINPTVNYYISDFVRLPIPLLSEIDIVEDVQRAISLAKADSNENETTYDFTEPPCWETGIDDVAHRYRKLVELEQEIDEEVYRLYGISDQDRAAIEAELTEPVINETSADESDDTNSNAEDVDTSLEAPLTRAELARQWISYSVGIVIGRFQPGIDGALGHGHFSSETSAKLRSLADSDGILVLDQGHPDDIAARVMQALQLMPGEEAATEVIAAGDADPQFYAKLMQARRQS